MLLSSSHTARPYVHKCVILYCFICCFDILVAFSVYFCRVLSPGVWAIYIRFLFGLLQRQRLKPSLDARITDVLRNWESQLPKTKICPCLLPCHEQLLTSWTESAHYLNMMYLISIFAHGLRFCSFFIRPCTIVLYENLSVCSVN